MAQNQTTCPKSIHGTIEIGWLDNLLTCGAVAGKHSSMLFLFFNPKRSSQTVVLISPFPHHQLDEKYKEAQGLVEQRDQVAAHLQQYSAAYQALASEREQLHRQYFTQSQLMDRLQHDESQGRAQLEVSQNELKRAQVCKHPPPTCSLVKL